MDEYISKQSVLDYLNGYLHSLGEGGADDLLFDRGQRRALTNVIQDILAVKAADVQPVVHAKWEISSDGYYPYCSRCFGRLNGELTKYCPECGTRMDGDTND